MSRRTYALLALALAIILFFALNIFAGSALRQARLDLTQNRLFTLNPGTIETLTGLGEAVTLRLYYSEQAATGYPQISSYARRVRDMLDALAGHAKGKLIVEIVKPEPFSPEEDRAVAAGITPVPTNGGDTIYFGLEGSNLADGHDVIGYLSPDRENLLEYDLVALIDRLNRLKKPVIGLIGSLPLATGPGGVYAALQGQSKPYRIYQDLESKYKIDFLGSDLDRIPRSVDVLLLAHPTGLSTPTLYAIDQFVLAGGHALLFIDPLSELSVESQQGEAQTPAGSTLEPLLSNWGVTMPAHEVVGDRALAQRVMIDETTRRVVDFIPWIGLTASEINREDPVTAELTQLNLGTAGHLERLKGATTSWLPLMTSSDNAMIIDGQSLQSTPDPDGLLRNFHASGERYILAARLTGPANSAFPDGPPPAAKKDPGDATVAPPPPSLKSAKGSINVIVVADTDLFDDRLWLSSQNVLGQQVSVPSASNEDFVLNAVDNLAGSNALLALRGRQIANRKFELVEAIRRDAEERYLAEEDALNRKIAAAQKNLEALQREGAENGLTPALMTPEQHAEVERFRQELTETRRALRAVQRNLRRDIDDLGGLLKLINIALMPLLVAAGAIGLAVVQRRRRARRVEAAEAPRA